MNKLPIECRARYEKIQEKAENLLETFINGNRRDTVEALESMEPRAALAVLATMMTLGCSCNQNALRNYLREVA